jgi:hypothetical protein
MIVIIAGCLGRQGWKGTGTALPIPPILGRFLNVEQVPLFRGAVFVEQVPLFTPHHSIASRLPPRPVV